MRIKNIILNIPRIINFKFKTFSMIKTFSHKYTTALNVFKGDTIPFQVEIINDDLSSLDLNDINISVVFNLINRETNEVFFQKENDSSYDNNFIVSEDKRKGIAKFFISSEESMLFEKGEYIFEIVLFNNLNNNKFTLIRGTFIVQ